MPSGNVAGILLAAGEGSRLGRPKAMIELGGQSLVRRGIALLRDGGADPVIVVTGATGPLGTASDSAGSCSTGSDSAGQQSKQRQSSTAKLSSRPQSWSRY